MDSIVNNEAGFKNGVFQNSQTDLLPWPDAKRGTSFFDVVTVSAGSRGGIAVIPNPYDTLGGGLSIVDFIVTYYNNDGTIRWTVTAVDIAGSTASFANPTVSNGGSYIIVEIDGIPHLLGRISVTNDNASRFFKINLKDVTYSMSSVATPNHQASFVVHSLGILESGTVFAVYQSSDKTTTKSCEINMVNLSKGVDLPDVAIIRAIRDGNGRPLNGVALFNGSIAMAEGGIYGINRDLDMTTSKASKHNVVTRHRDAVNQFNSIYQVSKDMFIGMGNSQTLYLDRTTLERWVSDCIHATTNFRIPVSN